MSMGRAPRRSRPQARAVRPCSRRRKENVSDRWRLMLRSRTHQDAPHLERVESPSALAAEGFGAGPALPRKHQRERIHRLGAVPPPAPRSDAVRLHHSRKNWKADFIPSILPKTRSRRKRRSRASSRARNLQVVFRSFFAEISPSLLRSRPQNPFLQREKRTFESCIPCQGAGTASAVLSPPPPLPQTKP